MDQQLVRDTIVYLTMIFGTIVVFGLIMWGAALVCRARAATRRCTLVLTLCAAAVCLPAWAIVMHTVVPAQEFLGPWWWLAFIAIPAILVVAASLVILLRGPDRPWRSSENLQAAVGSMLCGLLGLVLVWQQTDHVWGWATSMAGCGPVAGTIDWLVHRDSYRRLWWGNPEAWSTTRCASELDAKIGQATAARTAPSGTPEPGETESTATIP